MDYAEILKEAKEERDVLESRIAKLDRLIGVTEELACDDASVTAYKASTQEKGRKTGDGQSPRRSAPVMEATESAVSKSLERLMKRTMTSELLPLVIREGVEVGGKDQIATLSARLSNSKLFTNQRGEGWWFTDRPLPTDALLVESDDKTEGRETTNPFPSVFDPIAKGRQDVPGGGP